MKRKEVWIVLGIASGAAMLAISGPSYSEDIQAADVTLQIDQMDKQAQDRTDPADNKRRGLGYRERLQWGPLDWTHPAGEPGAAEFDEDMRGVAGRRAEEMADEGPAGPVGGFAGGEEAE